jgi:hypothetical protein
MIPILRILCNRPFFGEAMEEALSNQRSMFAINLRGDCCPSITAFAKIIGFIKKIIVGNLPCFVKPNQGFGVTLQ